MHDNVTCTMSCTYCCFEQNCSLPSLPFTPIQTDNSKIVPKLVAQRTSTDKSSQSCRESETNNVPVSLDTGSQYEDCSMADTGAVHTTSNSTCSQEVLLQETVMHVFHDKVEPVNNIPQPIMSDQYFEQSSTEDKSSQSGQESETNNFPVSLDTESQYEDCSMADTGAVHTVSDKTCSHEVLRLETLMQVYQDKVEPVNNNSQPILSDHNSKHSGAETSVIVDSGKSALFMHNALLMSMMVSSCCSILLSLYLQLYLIFLVGVSVF